MIPFRPDFEIARVKLHFVTSEVQGWNEVDAVGLLDSDGQTQWARAAHASSTYAERGPIPIADVPIPLLPPIEITGQPIPFIPAPLPEPIIWTPIPQPVPQPDLRALKEALDRLQAELEVVREQVRQLEKARR